MTPPRHTLEAGVISNNMRDRVWVHNSKGCSSMGCGRQSSVRTSACLFSTGTERLSRRLREEEAQIVMKWGFVCMHRPLLYFRFGRGREI